MSTDWRLIKLEDLGNIITGKTPPSSILDAFTHNNGTPFITPRDMDGRRLIFSTERYLSESGLNAVKRNVVPVNSVAVSCIGSDMGKTVIVQKSSVTNQQINTIIVNKNNFNPKFVYYSLSTRQQDLKDIAGGSATPILNKGHFGQFEINVPNIKTQNFIVDILDSLDTKIELNRQINQTLEAMAQALFKSWFVDFEPVKAKLSALTVSGSADDANLAAMSAISGKTIEQLLTLKTTNPDQYQQLYTTADLFPSEMVDSELGEIPKGWEVVGFEKIAQPKKGKNITKSTVIEGDVPVVAGGLEPAYYHNTPNVFSPVITVSASGANAGYVNLYHNDIWASDCSYISKGQTSYVYSVYCFLKLKQKEIYDMQQGAAQPHVYPKDLHRLRLASPESLTLWLKLEELVMPFFSMIKSHIQETHSLTQSRDTLLPKLLSGELLVDGVCDE